MPRKIIADGKAPASVRPNRSWADDHKELLRSLVRKHGEKGNWRTITQEFNQSVGRTQDQLSTYWRNVLKPKTETDAGSGTASASRTRRLAKKEEGDEEVMQEAEAMKGVDE